MAGKGNPFSKVDVDKLNSDSEEEQSVNDTLLNVAKSCGAEVKAINRPDLFKRQSEVPKEELDKINNEAKAYIAAQLANKSASSGESKGKGDESKGKGKGK